VGPLGVIWALGNGFTVVVADVLLVPQRLVTVTVNVPAAFTVILFAVLPVDHKYVTPVPVVAVKVVELPWQKVSDGELIEAIGGSTTVTACVADDVPHEVVPVTVYTPVEVTVIEGVVAPFDQT
jgi:hypothetical protein